MDTVSKVTVSIDANVSGAISGINQVNSALNSLTPGANMASQVMSRLAGGFYQLVQGVASVAYTSVAQGLSYMAEAGFETATAVEKATVAFQNLLPAEQDAVALMRDIQQNAVTTPFSVEGLAQGTQKLALITKDGKEAEKTILNIGKAVAAAGGGTAELNRIATNLQQIGNNSKITARDIREFGNAGIPIYELVAESANIAKNEVDDYLKDAADPYQVLVDALNKAGEAGGRYAEMYSASAQTIGQITENLTEGIGIFSKDVMNASGAMDKLKESMQALANGIVDPDFIGTVADAFAKLTKSIDGASIIEKVLDKIQKVLGAFNSGQFDNIVVFFKEFFNTLKQFSGISFIGNILKVFLDLFSDNHTAEEVRNVANQLATLVRVILEFKMITKVYTYIMTLFKGINMLVGAIPTFISGLKIVASGLSTLGSTMVTHPIVTVIGLIISLISVIALLKPDIFENFANAIAQGFENMINWLKDIPATLATVGNNMIVGLWNGLVEGFNQVIQGIRQFAVSIVNTFKGVLGIHSPSTVFRDEVGVQVSRGIALGILKGYKDIEDAIQDVMEELVSLQDDWIREMVDLNQFSLVDAANQYRAFAQLYTQGTKARMEMDRKAHEAEVDILKEIIDLVEEYNKAFVKARKSTMEYYDAFEYTQNVLTRSAWSVVEGLERQNKNMSQYYNNLLKISTMGFDADFLQYLYDAGMDAASEVAGLANATQEEIDKINELWATRGKLATDIAVMNTQQLKDETLSEISELQKGLEETAIDVYDTGTLLSYNITKGILDGAPTIWDAILSVGAKSTSAASDAADATEDVVRDAAEAIAATVEDFEGVLDRLDIQAFDTADAFSLLKNILNGIPWYVWAGAIAMVGFQIISLIPKIKEVIDFIRKTDDVVDAIEDVASVGTQAAKKGADAAGEAVSDSVSKATSKVSNMTYSASGKIGSNILKPFKKFNTWMQGLTSSIKAVLDSIFEVIGAFVDGVMGLIAKITGGIGKAIEAMLRPLADSKLLISGAVLIEIAAALFVFAAAAKACNDIQWESLGKIAVLAGILAAMSAVVAGISLIGTQILIGAAALAAVGVAIGIAAAAIGLGVMTLSKGLAEASLMAENISMTGLLRVLEAMGLVSLAFTLGIGLMAIGAISATIGTILAVDFLVISGALATGSNLGDSISLQGIANVTDGLAAVGTALTNAFLISSIGAVIGVVATIMSVEFIIIAGALAIGSNLGNAISSEGIAKVNDGLAAVGTAFTNAILISTIGAVAGAVASILSVEFLIISAALAAGSNLGNSISEEGIKKVNDGLASVGTAFTNAILISTIGSIAGVMASILSVEFLIIAAALAGGSNLGNMISEEGIKKVDEGIAAVAEAFSKLTLIAGVGSVAGSVATILSVEFLAIAQSLGVACLYAEAIKVESLQKVSDAVKYITQIDFGKFFDNWGKSASASKVAEIARNVEEVVSNISLACLQLAQVENISEVTLNGYLVKIKNVIATLINITYGSYTDANKNAKTSSKLKELSENIRDIINAIGDACYKLAEVDKFADGKIDDYQGKIQGIIESLTKITYGEYSDNKNKAKSTDKLKEIAEDVKSIIESITSVVKNLADLASSVGKGRVEGYVSQAQDIIKQFSEFQLKDENDGWLSTSDLQKTKEAAEKIQGSVSSIETIINATKTIVDILAGFTQQGITSKQVKEYVQDAKDIMKSFSEIKIDEDVTQEIADNVTRTATVADNVDKILESAKGVVENIIYFNKEEIGGKDKVIEYVKEANEIVAEFGKLALKENTENAYENLSKNTSDLANAVSNVKTILDNGREMYTALENFKQTYSARTVEAVVKDINYILACMTGGKDDDGNEHKGIHLPSDTQFTSGDVAVLEQVKNAISHVKDVASFLNQTEEVKAEKLTNIGEIIEFIKTKMTGLPKALEEYTSDFKNQGSAYAKAFIEGWSGEYTSAEQAGRDMQTHLWQAIENKMQDEYYQGAYMAETFANGLKSHGELLYATGQAAQSSFWFGVQGKMQDEFYQGQALGMQVVDGIYSTQWWWWHAGDDTAAGFAGGINRSLWRVNQAAGNLSDTAIKKLKDLLDIASPSKVMMKLGQYVSQGFAEGIENGLSEVENAGEKLAEAIMDGYNDSIEPLTASIDDSRAYVKANQGIIPTTSNNQSIVINQSNNVYDGMDASKMLADISWAIKHA